MRILAIGDIHGRDNWKDAAKRVDEFDQIVFTGDFCDSFDKKDIDILHNLNEILNFKKEYGDKIILIHGNHDLMNYYYQPRSCSGFRFTMMHDLYDLFSRWYGTFQLAHSVGNYLFSHAGVSLTWLRECKINSKLSLPQLVERINGLEHSGKGRLCLLHKTYIRGGSGYAGSCLWEDESEIHRHGLIPDVIQVFGHTPQEDIKYFKQNETTGYYAIDVLATKTKFLELEIKQ
jgi:3',5'-cyclic AMP phosphodiesterase CpdA